MTALIRNLTLVSVTALASSAAAAPFLGSFEVSPRSVAWDALSPTFFDVRMRLPDESRRGDTLTERMRELASLTFREGETDRTLGDLVVESRSVPTTERKAWFLELGRRMPELMSEWERPIRDLFLDEYLMSNDWDPGKDDARDGILMGDTWTLPDSKLGPWRDSKVAPEFEQGAALFVADLETIKAVENDYRAYRDHVGSTVEEIFPVRGRHLSGEDRTGRPFRSVAVFSRSDLPFPFSDYSCDLRILSCVDEEGLLRTDIYSTSPDFHYMAGQDVFFPVSTSSGETVAYLVVRDFGFDLAGVPDQTKHRREALRGTLGNLKRNVERRFAGSDFPAPEEVLASIRVLGNR